MGDVDYLDARGDSVHDRLADADRVVAQVEVTQEGDRPELRPRPLRPSGDASERAQQSEQQHEKRGWEGGRRGTGATWTFLDIPGHSGVFPRDSRGLHGEHSLRRA